METKSKYQIEIDAFKEKFSEMKDKKIAIYGIGRRTATLLPGITEFQVVGLLDRQSENIGMLICNIPVMSLEDVERKADLIIINSDPTNYYTIYKRIHNCKIPVYFSNGEKAVLNNEDDEYRENPYWSNSIEQVKKKIDAHDVISFDLFDTLIMRKTYMPQDVFQIVERQGKDRGNIDINFAVERQKAVSSIEEIEPTLEGIYRNIEINTGISKEQVLYLKEIELEVERKVCIPRDTMVQLFKYAQEQGKEVYIITDMYLPRSEISSLMLQCGIIGIDQKHVWISGEKNLSKRDGTMWSVFRKNVPCGKKILHLGDNRKTDIEQAVLYSIDAEYVMSAKEMLNNSSIKDLAVNILTLKDSMHIGLLISRLFNDPYSLCDTRGSVHINDCNEFGYGIYGAMTTRFLLWLYHKACNDQNKMLSFFARDGYFLIEDFNYIQEKYCGSRLQTQYIPISRRLIYIATIESAEDYKRVIEFPYVGTFREYMHSRFNIEVDSTTEMVNDKIINAVNDGEQLLQWMKPYEDKIRNEIQYEKQNYRSYIEKYIDVETKQAVVDMGYYGTTQFYYQRFIDRKTDGYYFFACLTEQNPYTKECSMKCCYNDNGILEGNKGLVGGKSAFLESFLTAPYGMLRYIDASNDIVYEPDKNNQKNFQKKVEANKGIKDYLDAFIALYGIDDIDEQYGKIEGLIYNTLVNGSCVFSDKVLEGFYFDNDMVGGREIKLEV